MKCQQCSTDAPAETDPQSGRLRCPKCHAFLGTGTTQTAAVRQARDILQKWSSADLLDQISSFPQVPPLADPLTTEPPAPEPSADSSDSRPEDTPDEANDDHHSALPAVTQPTGNGTDTEPSDDNSDPGPDILSMADAGGMSQDEPAAEPDDERPPMAPIEPADLPQLSILRTEEPPRPAETEAAPRSGPESTGTQKSGAPEETTKKKSRRLTRHVPRRRPRPAEAGAADSPSFHDSVQQGTDTVKKKLRVDRPGSHAPAGDMTASVPEPVADPRAQDAVTSRRYRIDTAEDVQQLTDGAGRVRSQGRPHRRYVDEPHESLGLRGPHFQVAPPKRSSLTSLTGQFLAYIGVLGLTIGTAIVIYGHFGGMSEYTPTGWLVTTVAQMLLFLGVINLVSGGIEQNNDDVSRRINVLGEQLMRLEQVTESALQGPKIPVERYAGTASAEETSEREVALVDERLR